MGTLARTHASHAHAVEARARSHTRAHTHAESTINKVCSEFGAQMHKQNGQWSELTRINRRANFKTNVRVERKTLLSANAEPERTWQ